MTKKSEPFHYFDSSILLRYAIDHEHALRNLDTYTDNAVTSAITRVECMRVLDRWRITKEISDEKLSQARSACLKLLSAIGLIDVDTVVIDIASQTFPIALKSLDSIHLATALLLKRQYNRDVVVLTHDIKLSLACHALELITIA